MKAVDEVRRRDVQVFLAEAVGIQRLTISMVSGVLIIWLIGFRLMSGSHMLAWVIGLPLIAAAHLISAWQASEARRFHHAHLAALWAGCQDRLRRFQEVQKRARDTAVADLREMPKTIELVANSVYRALRKADIVAFEVSASESGLQAVPKPIHPISNDPQSRELFQVADRNIAEYNQGLEAVMGGVQRSEAQAAVFMTTLDTLRMKMLGYRLVGRGPELPSHEFLAAIAEAKLQLESIDKALDELDLSLYPSSIAVIRQGPPSAPPSQDEEQKLEGRG
jgi:hypothetical protein